MCCSSPATAPSPGGAAVDRAVLDALIEDPGDRATVHQVIASFLDRAEHAVLELRDAVGRGDLPAVLSIARGLKGTSARLGARALSSACADLERAARERDVADAVAYLTSLEALLRAAAVALRAEIGDARS